MRYPIVIHKDPGTAYGVTVPDLPGCFSAGDTFDEALDLVREAIACHLEDSLKDGEPAPAPSPVEVHQADDDFRGGVWAIVDVDVAKLSSKARRINITMPERVLAIVDQAAVREGVSRSGFLTRAAVGYVQRRSEEGLILADGSREGPSYRADRERRDVSGDDG